MFRLEGRPHIRLQASCFLEGVVNIVEAATETTPKEEILQQFNDHVRRNVALLLGIPESLYHYHSQTPDLKPQSSG